MSDRTERRLAAIVAADVAGYSRLIGADEEGTRAAFRAHRAELIDPLLAEHGGRVGNTAGDGLILEFPSVVDAVRCAVEVQRGMAARNEGVPEDRQIRFRIGVNLGDVVYEDGEPHGEGVIIAARLEALAEPGGICLSLSARDQVLDRLDLALGDLGEVSVKNVARPVRVFRVLEEGEIAPQPRPRRRWPALAAAAAVLVALLAGSAFLWSPPWLAPGGGTTSDPQRIAVLPFANISADPGDAYFSDGLTEELISRLSRIGELGVIARTSAMQYKDTDKGIDQIGRELSVGTVLEGSVRKSGEKVRITAQLIDVSSQEHLWSADYDRDLQDVFAIQSEISSAVVDALKLTLVSDTGSQLAKGTDNIEAYTLYLKGWYLFLNERTKDGYEQAIRYFEQALEIDPDYAPAYAGLAQVYNQGAWVMGMPASESFPKANEMAERALALDPNSADAWSALASAEVEYYWDWEAGERAVKRALEIDPNHVLTLSLYAHRLLSAVYGRYDEAVATMERVVALDPLSLQPHTRFGLVLWHAGMLDRAIEQFRETIATWPNYMFSYMGLSWAYSAKGMHGEAIEQMLIAADLSNRSSYVLGYLANTYARAGKREEALALVKELEQRAKTSQVSASALVFAYAGLGDVDRMMDAFEQMYEARHPEMVFLRIGEWLDPYRSDPRFIALMKRVGFPTD